MIIVLFIASTDAKRAGLYLECSGWWVTGEQGVSSPPLLLFSLRSRPPKIQLRVWGSAVSYPSGV